MTFFFFKKTFFYEKFKDLIASGEASSYIKSSRMGFVMHTHESILFIEWFIEKKLGIQISNKKRDEFYQILQQAFLNINSQNDTLVLRDYHVDNLILKDHKEPLKQVGLIDFQDALLGSSFYDLASLLEDVRMPLNENEKEEEEESMSSREEPRVSLLTSRLFPLR